VPHRISRRGVGLRSETSAPRFGWPRSLAASEVAKRGQPAHFRRSPPPRRWCETCERQRRSLGHRPMIGLKRRGSVNVGGPATVESKSTEVFTWTDRQSQGLDVRHIPRPVPSRRRGETHAGHGAPTWKMGRVDHGLGSTRRGSASLIRRLGDHPPRREVFIGAATFQRHTR